MNRTLTIQLDAELLESAEQEARAHRTTLPEVVKRYLKIMAENWRGSRAGKTPITDELRGVLHLPADADPKEIVAEELRRKYGD